MTPTKSEAPAPTAPIISSVRESVLRTAARSLPGAYNQRGLTIHDIASRIRSARFDSDFDLETGAAIDAWLAHYGGES